MSLLGSDELNIGSKNPLELCVWEVWEVGGGEGLGDGGMQLLEIADEINMITSIFHCSGEINTFTVFQTRLRIWILARIRIIFRIWIRLRDTNADSNVDPTY